MPGEARKQRACHFGCAECGRGQWRSGADSEAGAAFPQRGCAHPVLDQHAQLGLHLLLWLTRQIEADADPQASSTLVLMLEHKQLPGMVKQGNKFLKAFKPLPFDTIKLVSAETGEVLQDLPDPEDNETDKADTATGTATETSPPSPKEKPDLLARLTALTPRIKEFAAAADVAGQKAGADLEAKKLALAPRNRLLTLVRDCKGMIGTNDEQAEAMLVDIEGILSSDQANVAPSTELATAAGRWSAARADAVEKLQAEIKEVLATKDPDAGKAELELQAVLRQLKAKMETQQEAAEMERYLDQNDVVTAIDILAFPLKRLLLDLLNEIKPALPA